MLSDGYVKVTHEPLAKYLKNKGIVKEYMRHHTTNDKFEDFRDKVYDLVYGEL